MSRKNRPGFLRLVHSTEASQRTATSAVHESDVQGTFLPSNHPGTLIFLSWSKTSADDLLDVFELSVPRIIFDLRLTPKFDLSQINRRQFFELARKHGCQYIDLLGRMGLSEKDNAQINPTLMASEIGRFTNMLSVPNYGPFVFLHDDTFVDDSYVGNLAKALPPSPESSWRVFRPTIKGELPSYKAHEVGGDTSADRLGVSDLIRPVIFVSHATPQDNTFVKWLVAKLASCGYEVWSDITMLDGGDTFWRSIEDVIRFRAAKVLFVHSEHVKGKSGVRKEVYLGLKVGERNRLQRFVVPIRIDSTPFDDTLIELIDIQSIDFRQDWLAGLVNLLALLERDHVPRALSFRSDQFSRLISKFSRPAVRLGRVQETLTSNWLSFVQLPQSINFFSCTGISTNHLPEIANNLQLPAFAYFTHIATPATRAQFEKALAAIGYANVHVGVRATIPWQDFLTGQFQDLPSWTSRDARNWAFGLLNKAWAVSMEQRNLAYATLANGRRFWFYRNDQLPANESRFHDRLGRLMRRQLVGRSLKRQVYWHFGIQARSALKGDAFHLVLTPHVTFSNDGKIPLQSNAQLHSLRRSFCRSWWNDRWRDLLCGFIAALAGDDESLGLEIGAEIPLSLRSTFDVFTSPISPISESEANELVQDSLLDEVPEDVWEDEYEGPEEVPEAVENEGQNNDVLGEGA